MARWWGLIQTDRPHCATKEQDKKKAKWVQGVPQGCNLGPILMSYLKLDSHTWSDYINHKDSLTLGKLLQLLKTSDGFKLECWSNVKECVEACFFKAAKPRMKEWPSHHPLGSGSVNEHDHLLRGLNRQFSSAKQHYAKLQGSSAAGWTANQRWHFSSVMMP